MVEPAVRSLRYLPIIKRAALFFHRRYELTSIGVRVNPEVLKQQLETTGQLDFLKLPYH